MNNLVAEQKSNTEQRQCLGLNDAIYHSISSSLPLNLFYNVLLRE